MLSVVYNINRFVFDPYYQNSPRKITESIAKNKMIEILPLEIIEKIVEKLDSQSNMNLAEAAKSNKDLSTKLNNFKFNVCPFCVFRRLSNQLSLVHTTTGETAFDHDEAFHSFLNKNLKLFKLENKSNIKYFTQISDKIAGTYVDDDLIEYTFEQVLNENSLVNAWKSVVKSSPNFTDEEFDNHLLLHFIAFKNSELKGPLSIEKMHHLIKDTAQQHKFIIDPKYYRNDRFLLVGSVQNEFNRIISSKFIYSDNVIATDLDQYAISLSKYLINETLKLIAHITLISEPTDSLIYMCTQFVMLKQIFERI